MIGACVRRVLEAEGLEVFVVPDATQALEVLARGRCRLVLCDLMLPDRSGLELIRELHAVRPEVPLVVITGYATAANEAQARQAGASDFLPKPFDDAELLAVVRRALSSLRDEGRPVQGRRR